MTKHATKRGRVSFQDNWGFLLYSSYKWVKSYSLRIWSHVTFFHDKPHLYLHHRQRDVCLFLNSALTSTSCSRSRTYLYIKKWNQFHPQVVMFLSKMSWAEEDSKKRKSSETKSLTNGSTSFPWFHCNDTCDNFSIVPQGMNETWREGFHHLLWKAIQSRREVDDMLRRLYITSNKFKVFRADRDERWEEVFRLNLVFLSLFFGCHYFMPYSFLSL